MTSFAGITNLLEEEPSVSEPSLWKDPRFAAELRAGGPVERAIPELLQAPRNMEDLGLSEGLVIGLFLKHAHKAGHCTIRNLSTALCLT
ncbi:MAG: hypothetical protein KGN84_10440, partial [Acidobacteriota bacterium]|nr:hypothetical protein [Acidobacteriota bacterium]